MAAAAEPGPEGAGGGGGSRLGAAEPLVVVWIESVHAAVASVRAARAAAHRLEWVTRASGAPR